MAGSRVEGLMHLAFLLGMFGVGCCAWYYHEAESGIGLLSGTTIVAMVILAIVDLRLSNEHLRVLNEASAIELGFPHDMLEKPRPQALAFGGMRPLIDV